MLFIMLKKLIKHICEPGKQSYFLYKKTLLSKFYVIKVVTVMFHLVLLVTL